MPSLAARLNRAFHDDASCSAGNKIEIPVLNAPSCATFRTGGTSSVSSQTLERALLQMCFADAKYFLAGLDLVHGVLCGITFACDDLNFQVFALLVFNLQRAAIGGDDLNF